MTKMRDKRLNSADRDLLLAFAQKHITWGIIHLTPDYSSGSYLLMQRAIPPQPRGGCYAR